MSLCASEAPAIHGGLSLEERAENALCGFLLHDLWALLGRRREIKAGVPKGSHQLAPQTRQTLQAVSLCTAVITCTKDPSWAPWSMGPQHLSEIHIERQFGKYRRFTPSGDLSARSYWHANAATARSQLTKMRSSNQPEPKLANEPHLSEEVLLVLECLGMSLKFSEYLWNSLG